MWYYVVSMESTQTTPYTAWTSHTKNAEAKCPISQHRFSIVQCHCFAIRLRFFSVAFAELAHLARHTNKKVVNVRSFFAVCISHSAQQWNKFSGKGTQERHKKRRQTWAKIQLWKVEKLCRENFRGAERCRRETQTGEIDEKRNDKRANEKNQSKWDE